MEAHLDSVAGWVVSGKWMAAPPPRFRTARAIFAVVLLALVIGALVVSFGLLLYVAGTL